MTAKMKNRPSQVSQLTTAPVASVPARETTDPHNVNLDYLRNELEKQWELGRNMVLSWCRLRDGIALLVVPYYLSPLLHMERDTTGSAAPDIDTALARETANLLRMLITGTREVCVERIVQIGDQLGIEPLRLRLPCPKLEYRPAADMLDDLVRRFSISYVNNRAVALIDIVGFSLLGPFEQAIQVNSLAYSINSAHNKLLEKGIDVEFARTTTGDGFYLWNRVADLEANIRLYNLLHLVLADNAIAQSKSTGKSVPVLKTAFCLGNCYEFYETQGLRQTVYDYIVGDVTIELARIIEQAQPGSILMGDFSTRLPTLTLDTGMSREIDTVGFISELQGTLEEMHGIELSDEKIQSIRCYLTGDITENGDYSISRFRITDKHGLPHYVYNAKVNIYREGGEPIYLGIRQQDARLSICNEDSNAAQQKNSAHEQEHDTSVRPSES